MNRADDLLRQAAYLLTYANFEDDVEGDGLGEERYSDANKLLWQIHEYLAAPKEPFADSIPVGVEVFDKNQSVLISSEEVDKSSCIENAENYARFEEPVAYINLDEKRLEWAAPFEFKSSCFVLGKVPLYFHPPRPMKPMTVEEISDVLNVDPQWFMDGLNWKALDLLEYARAIERHHGISGEK